MTVAEEIVFWLRLKGISRQEANVAMETYLDSLEIKSCIGKRTSQLSKGQQQRVALVIALASKPKFLVLDEPFSGLDPIGMDKISAAIKAANENGNTIMISTHMIEYASHICSDLCFINKGQILKSGSTAEIANLYAKIKVKLLDTVTSEDIDKYFTGIIAKISAGEIIVPDSVVAREILKKMGTLISGMENLKPDFREIFRMLNTKQNSPL
jgi:ABC-2 type transport system ATP-binding protein